MSPSFHSYMKCADLAGSSVSDGMMIDESDNDYTRSYHVYMDINPISDFRGLAYDGDIYAWVGGSAEECGIYIQKGGEWITWNPTATLQVVMVDLVAYATACETQGIKYVTTVEQASRMSPSIPTDILTLAGLIADDIKYPRNLKSRKRSPPAEVVSQPRKRSRTKQVVPGKFDDQEIQMDEDRNEGPSDKNAWGEVKRTQQQLNAATTASVEMRREDVSAAMKHMELGDRPALKDVHARLEYEEDHASTISQGLRSEEHRLLPLLKAELDDARRHASELDRRLQVKGDEADMLRSFAVRIREERHEALLREELAQGMMIGAEKRLRDKEAEYTQVLKWSKWMMEDHAKEVARLKAEIQAKTESASKTVDERSRLVATIKEIKLQIEEGYLCDICYDLMCVPATMTCGHTTCVECAVRDWLRGAVLPRRHDYGMQLSQSRCPCCRQPHPRVELTWANGVTQRHHHCLPFINNIKLGGNVSALWERLRATVRELHACMPTDKQGMEWMEEYGNDDARENLQVRDRTRCHQELWTRFRTAFLNDSVASIYRNPEWTGMLSYDKRAYQGNQDIPRGNVRFHSPKRLYLTTSVTRNPTPTIMTSRESIISESTNTCDGCTRKVPSASSADTFGFKRRMAEAESATPAQLYFDIKDVESQTVQQRTELDNLHSRMRGIEDNQEVVRACVENAEMEMRVVKAQVDGLQTQLAATEERITTNVTSGVDAAIQQMILINREQVEGIMGQLRDMRREQGSLSTWLRNLFSSRPQQ
ncbi:hypothetical protein HD554DRAFT_2043717 [Boletus coccyginus]|nr:hypothetical protein HD554DRAFT_2043717 [Boletus coccyginus]